MLLGGILTDFFNLDQRNYNLASGFSVKSGVQLTWDKERFCVSATNSLYRLFTWKGYSPTVNLRQVDERTFNVMATTARPPSPSPTSTPSYASGASSTSACS